MSSDDQFYPPARHTEAVAPPGRAVLGGPAEVSGVLIVRAWLEGLAQDRLRIRILARRDVLKAAEASMAADSIDEAVEFVRGWLTEFSGGSGAVTKR
jgi:hypothetical protein